MVHLTTESASAPIGQDAAENDAPPKKKRSKKPKEMKPWKRAARIIAQCRGGKTLCRYNRPTETGGTEIVFFLEPGGKQVGRKSAENAIALGLLTPSADGLFGAEFSQTWSAQT